jgi:predicted transposase YbfD/YdcC
LKLLTLKGAIVTIDAMGCQKEIAQTIVEKEADYVLALKGNQGTLSDDVELFFAEQKACNFKDTVISRHRTLEKSHGRIETRTYTAIGDIDWLTKCHPGWKGLKSIVMVESVREIVGGKTEHETRFYISSLAADAKLQGEAIRIRTANAPANFATIKHMAGNLLRHGAGKQSLRVKRRLAAWDDDYLASLIMGA